MHAGRAPTRSEGLVNPAVHRGSTVLQPDMKSRIAAGKRWRDQALVYGVYGNPTHFALEDAVAEIEGRGQIQQKVSQRLKRLLPPDSRVD